MICLNFVMQKFYYNNVVFQKFNPLIFQFISENESIKHVFLKR